MNSLSSLVNSRERERGYSLITKELSIVGQLREVNGRYVDIQAEQANKGGCVVFVYDKEANAMWEMRYRTHMQKPCVRVL